jgi:hypothetical protein
MSPSAAVSAADVQSDTASDLKQPKLMLSKLPIEIQKSIIQHVSLPISLVLQRWE